MVLPIDVNSAIRSPGSSTLAAEFVFKGQVHDIAHV